MANEDDIDESPATPAAPTPKLDLAKIRRLLETAARMTRLPGSEFMLELCEQLRLARDEINGTAGKISQAQTETLRVMRELETANQECGTLREEVLKLHRKAIPAPAPKAAQPALSEPEQASAPAPRKRPGPKPKNVVNLPPQANAQ